LKTKYTPLHALVQRMASSAPGSWFLARVLHRLDRLTVRLSGGRWSLTGILAGVPVMMVTTTGARSGRPRTAPLLCIWDKSHPSRFALIASNWGQKHIPGWYFNLKANPQATCSIDGRSGAYAAHEATEEEYERFWGYATETYGGYWLYKKRAGRRIPIVVMEPARQ
jgi:deazaflavin-dependent oxidoreductase (nitroreductase family)